VIAATNKDLEAAIERGEFREDLFFRLNVIPVFVPPLRERGDDVLLLTEHFMKEFAVEYGRRPKRLSPEATAMVRRYSWPGNVRELRNVIERLIIMVPGETIEAADLSFLMVPLVSERPLASTPVQPLFEARDAWERAYVLKALTTCEGNISRTADVLGLERSNLYKKMRALGIAPARDRDDA
jgi:two-component system nitrogen regulation response regulator NtrX